MLSPSRESGRETDSGILTLENRLRPEDSKWLATLHGLRGLLATLKSPRPSCEKSNAPTLS